MQKKSQAPRWSGWFCKQFLATNDADLKVQGSAWMTPQ
jgi:hypothetical protein